MGGVLAGWLGNKETEKGTYMPAIHVYAPIGTVFVKKWGAWGASVFDQHFLVRRGGFCTSPADWRGSFPNILVSENRQTTMFRKLHPYPLRKSLHFLEKKSGLLRAKTGFCARAAHFSSQKN